MLRAPTRLGCCLVALMLAACTQSSPGGNQGHPSPSAPASSSPRATPSLSPSPSPSEGQAPAPSPTPTIPPVPLGPGGLTLEQEVGAVLMVGFEGPLTTDVLGDWRARQFGGLAIVNNNHNAATATALVQLIASVRAASAHRVLVATDQEGGSVCLAIGGVPCYQMPVGETGTAGMASGLRRLGFDIDLGPVSDVCSGPTSIMWGRCYGTDPAIVSSYVGSVVDGIHSAGMLSAAKHFPGHGDTTVSSETYLPRIDAGISTLQARELPPFRAAIAHGTDLVMLGHLYYPSLDPIRSADLSPATVDLLRGQLGFRGAILSDDMEMGAITNTTPAPEAAIEFLLAGGDMVIIGHDLAVADATFDAVLAAVRSGRLSRSRLDDAVKTLQALKISG